MCYSSSLNVCIEKRKFINAFRKLGSFSRLEIKKDLQVTRDFAAALLQDVGKGTGQGEP